MSFANCHEKIVHSNNKSKLNKLTRIIPNLNNVSQNEIIQFVKTTANMSRKRFKQ